MKKILCLIIIHFIAGIMFVSAQSTVGNGIILKVNGLMNISIDQYAVVFSVVQTAETIAEAEKMIDSRIQRFVADLNSMGIDKTAINSETVKLIPLYDHYSVSSHSSNYIAIPKGFEVHKNITVLYKSSAMIDRIYIAAVRYEIYDIIKIDYFIQNIEKEMDSLRKVSMQYLLAKSKVFEANGIKLDITKSAISEEFSTLYPPTQYQSFTPSGENSFPITTYSKKKRRKSYASVRKLRSANPKEIAGFYTVYKVPAPYYNSISYGIFDVIVNPIIIEPVAQINYSLTISYPLIK